MAAAVGTIKIVYPSNVKKSLSVYLSDVSGVSVKFAIDAVATANSPDSYVATGPCSIGDLCLKSDVATPTSLVLKLNDQPVGVVLTANHLASVNGRDLLNIVMNRGEKLTIFQAA